MSAASILAAVVTFCVMLNRDYWRQWLIDVRQRPLLVLITLPLGIVFVWGVVWGFCALAVELVQHVYAAWHGPR